MTADEPTPGSPASGGRAAERRREHLAREFGEDFSEESGGASEQAANKELHDEQATTGEGVTDDARS